MSDMIYTAKSGEEIVFDDFVKSTEEYKSYWVEICPRCHNKYKHILGNRCSEEGDAQGTCSVKGCWNEADYYVDFDMNEVKFEQEK